jgi:hypothetical protein
LDLAEAVAEKDRVLLDCLEHISFCEGLIFEWSDYCFGLDVCFFAQDHALSEDMVAKRASQTAQQSCMADQERRMTN